MTRRERQIGTLGERSLHAALKVLLAQPGDQLETPINGYVIDIVRPAAEENTPPLCIEIQTGSFAHIKDKLAALLVSVPVRLVHPVPLERTVVRVEQSGEIVSRHKSPKRGSVLDVFPELVFLRPWLAHPSFSLDVLLIREETIWINDGRGSWRRKRWSIADRRLIEVVSQHRFASPSDYAALLPAALPDPFDTGHLAKALRTPRHRAGKMVYCLRAMGLLEPIGKRGNALLYRRVTDF